MVWFARMSTRRPVRRLARRTESYVHEICASRARTRGLAGGSAALATFAEVIDVSGVVRERRRMHIRYLAVRGVSVLLIVGAVVVAMLPAVMQSRSARRLTAVSDASARTVAGWPSSMASEELARARAYNRRLAEQGQPVLGEAVDPFAVEDGGVRDGGSSDSMAADDERYQALLDSGAGIMGTVAVPRIGVELPIRHGTSERVLAVGAGHLYGTSLPIGGRDSHAVVTGHRGLVDAAMFTRLDELSAGDFMYLEVMGETLGYQVDRIDVIEPDDVSRLKIVPGEDRLTLMTCTPYGVNTHRLLVSGHRVAIPLPAPDPSDVHDARTIGLRAFAACLAGGLPVCLLAVRLTRRRRQVMRHAAARPGKGESAGR